MAIKVEARAGGAAALVNGAQDQILLAADGEVLLPAQKDLEQSAPQAIVTKEMLEQASAMPRFSTSLWTGKADAMPEGYVQSSGQQLLDLMFPGLRSDVMASQHTCTEAEWQADPYKRVTHWSLGDGASWMRTPDKNGVQDGNVGGFYGAGSNPARGIFGTAVIDAMRNIIGEYGNPNARDGGGGEYFSGAFSVYAIDKDCGGAETYSNFGTILRFDASRALPAGTTTDPVSGEFRPRTFYGVWIICIYGKITNKGELRVAGINARAELLDARISKLEADTNAMGELLDARISTLEAVQKPLGYGQRIKDVTATKRQDVNYTNNTGQTIMVYILSNRFAEGGGHMWAIVDGVQVSFFDTGGANYTSYPIYSSAFAVPNKSTYRVFSYSGIASWLELTSE